MKFRNTWILAGIAVAFGLYMYFGEYKKAAKEEADKQANEKVLNVEVGKVKKVEIKNDNGDFVLDRGDDKKWKLESPLKDDGDDNMMSGILNGVTSAKFDQTIEGEDLKSFGLDKPKSSITLTLQDGSAKKVDAGIDGAMPGKVYLERDGDKKVLYADASFKTQLDRNTRDFRDKRIFKGNKGDIQSIVVKYETKGIVSSVGLIKKGGDWWLADQKEAKADADVISGFVDAIDGMRATDFAAETANETAGLKKYGLDKPAVFIRLEDKDQKPLAEISVSGKKDNNIYVKVAGSPTIYQCFAASLDQLLHNPIDFRDKKEPFDINRDDIREIQLTGNGKEYHIVKSGANWIQASPDAKKEVSQIQVANFLDKVANLRVSEFIPSEKPKGMDVPKGVMVLKGDKGKELLNVVWGGETKSQRSFFTKTNKVSYVFGTDTTSLNGLTGQPLITDKDAFPNPSPVSGTAAGGTRNMIMDRGGMASSKGSPKVAQPVIKKPEIIDVKGPGETH